MRIAVTLLDFCLLRLFLFLIALGFVGEGVTVVVLRGKVPEFSPILLSNEPVAIGKLGTLLLKQMFGRDLKPLPLLLVVQLLILDETDSRIDDTLPL